MFSQLKVLAEVLSVEYFQIYLLFALRVLFSYQVFKCSLSTKITELLAAN